LCLLGEHYKPRKQKQKGPRGGGTPESPDEEKCERPGVGWGGEKGTGGRRRKPGVAAHKDEELCNCKAGKHVGGKRTKKQTSTNGTKGGKSGPDPRRSLRSCEKRMGTHSKGVR